MGLFDLFRSKKEESGFTGILIPPVRPVPSLPVKEERKAVAADASPKPQEVTKEMATEPAPPTAQAVVTRPAPETLQLEELLLRAGSEPEYRAEFYKRLLTDELIIIIQGNGTPPGRQTLTENMQVNIASFPDGVLPVFSSTDRIFDKGIVKQEVHFMAVPGAQLFAMTKGATFALNPYSDHGKKLEVAEIEALLSGQIFSDEARMLNVDKEVKVMIGQPAEYPVGLVAALKPLLASISGVKAAYLGWIQHPDLPKPNFIFAVDAEGDFRAVSSAIAGLATKHIGSDDIIDVIKIEPGPGISSYFLEQTEPFYVI